MLGGSFWIAFLRNAMSAGLMMAFFLLLDRPRFSMKKTIWCYVGYFLFIITSFSVWYLLDSPSFVRFAALLSFLLIGIFCTLMSGDTIFLSLYKMALSFYVFSVCVFCGVDVSRWFFQGNIWVDIIVRFMLLGIILIITIGKIRKAFLESVDYFIDEMDLFCVVTLFVSIFVGAVVAYWPNLQGFSIFNMVRAFFILFMSGILQYTIFHMYFHMGKANIYQKEKELLEINERLLCSQLELIRKSEEETARVRHDIRHHCLLMEEYIKNDEKEELLSYVKQYRADLESLRTEQICSNEAANRILSAYARRAEEEGIQVSLDVSLAKSVDVRDIDLVAILANVFENAIHGCSHSGADVQKIDICIHQKGNKIVMQFWNTCTTDVKFRNGVPESHTGKAVGVSSIMKVVSRYNGEADFSVEHGMFIARILLNLST